MDYIPKHCYPQKSNASANDTYIAINCMLGLLNVLLVFIILLFV